MVLLAKNVGETGFPQQMDSIDHDVCHHCILSNQGQW